MRRLVLLAAAAVTVCGTSGCLLNIYSSDPARRTHQLMVVSENLRMITDEWERIWFVDQPDHNTPYRIHGGIMPGSHLP